MVVDTRVLNELALNDAYPMKSQEDMVEDLQETTHRNTRRLIVLLPMASASLDKMVADHKRLGPGKSR